MTRSIWSKLCFNVTFVAHSMLVNGCAVCDAERNRNQDGDGIICIGWFASSVAEPPCTYDSTSRPVSGPFEQFTITKQLSIRFENLLRASRIKYLTCSRSNVRSDHAFAFWKKGIRENAYLSSTRKYTSIYPSGTSNHFKSSFNPTNLLSRKHSFQLIVCS